MFVSVVHALRIHYYGNDSIRRIKTDKADAIKIANYGLDHWNSLLEYNSESEIRQQLKQLNRQYYEYMKIRIELANNLTSLLDQTFPNEKRCFLRAQELMDMKSGLTLHVGFGIQNA